MANIMIHRLLGLGLILVLTGCTAFKEEFGLAEENTAWLEVYLEGAPFSDRVATRTYTLPVSGSEIQVFDRPVLSTREFSMVRLVEVRYGYALELTTTNHGRHQLARTTGQHLGYRLVLVVNGIAIGARRIDGMLDDGVLYSFVEVEDEGLEELVRKLNHTIRYAARKGF